MHSAYQMPSKPHASARTCCHSQFATLRVASDSLRNDLSTNRGQLPSASCDSVRKHAATLTTVFEQCSGRLEPLARDAQGHASGSVMLQQSWPK